MEILKAQWRMEALESPGRHVTHASQPRVQRECHRLWSATVRSTQQMASPLGDGTHVPQGKVARRIASSTVSCSFPSALLPEAASSACALVLEATVLQSIQFCSGAHPSQLYSPAPAACYLKLNPPTALLGSWPCSDSTCTTVALILSLSAWQRCGRHMGTAPATVPACRQHIRSLPSHE